MWTQKQIESHKQAARMLIEIKDLVLDFISKNKQVSEYEVQQFIVGEYNKKGLKTDNYPPIVAFGKNTCNVHYYPNKNSKKLEDNDLILIDLWARLKTKNSPFADITWMAYNGKEVPFEINDKWKLVKQARDDTCKLIRDSLEKNEIPTGEKASAVTQKLFEKAGFKEKHFVGHSLGTKEDHGKYKSVEPSNKRPILKNLGHTIEPGIYIDGKFGVRSEIDFYISKDNKLLLTTEVQEKITLL